MRNKHFLTALIFLIVSFFLLPGCDKKESEKGSPEYIAAIKQWHKARIERLKKENGWLNLAGLFWLKEGVNTFGTSPSNDIVFPKGKAPDKIGMFILKDSTVTVEINPGAEVMNDQVPVKEASLKTDLSGNPTILSIGSLRWYIIKRGEKFGVRLRNLDADLLKEFEGIDTYPVNEDWKIKAKFEPYNPPKTISIPTIIGTVEEDKTPGALVFKKDGKEYRLDPVDEGDEFFVIFADETSSEETYGAGRFLYTEVPESAGNVILDFNKAYNPPCAFTPYATCPLPPKQNYLKLRVTAGEKKYGNE
jgi:uncharacterized protein (DUF1684 family)